MTTRMHTIATSHIACTPTAHAGITNGQDYDANDEPVEVHPPGEQATQHLRLSLPLGGLLGPIANALAALNCRGPCKLRGSLVRDVSVVSSSVAGAVSDDDTARDNRSAHTRGDVGGHARSWSYVNLYGIVHLAAAGARGLLGYRSTADGMHVEHGWAVGGRPSVAPFGQRDDGGSQVATLVGQQVFIVFRILGVVPTLHDSGLDESIQAVLEDVRCDSKLEEVVETGCAGEQRVPDDQQAPPLAHEFERSSGRAHLGVIGFPEHAPSLPSELA
jgi:hypothetical protein